MKFGAIALLLNENLIDEMDISERFLELIGIYLKNE